MPDSTANLHEQGRNLRQPLPARQAKGFSTDLIVFLLYVGDILSVLISGFVTLIALSGQIQGTSTAEHYPNIIVLGSVVGSFAILLSDAYEGDGFFKLALSLRRALSGWLLAMLMMLIIGFAFKVTSDYSRLFIGSWFLSAAGLLVVHRSATFLIARRLRSNSVFESRAAIIGAGNQGQKLLRYFKANPNIMVRVIAFGDDRADRVPDQIDDVPVVGGVSRIIDLIREDRVDQVFVCLPWQAAERVKQVILELSQTPVKIRLAPDLALFEFGNRSVNRLGDMPVVNLFDRPISGLRNVSKMAEDYILATLITLALSPVLLAIALAVRLDSSGPVFFRQDREGFNNKTFKVFKFRTMYHDMCEAREITQASEDDPRVTRVGRFLRRTSLDELPQLFNVLLGQMSLVGPRPHAPGTKAAGIPFAKAVGRYAARHRVKPGITGLAQVNGWRGETDTVEKLEQRIRFDLEYIDNWSLTFDLFILVKTGLVVLGQKEAY